MFALLFLLFFGASNVIEVEYTPLKNIEIEKYRIEYISLIYRDVEYSVDLEFFSQSNEYQFSTINNTFVISSLYILEFIDKENGFPILDCKEARNLEFYDVDWEILNSQNRFYGQHSPQNLDSRGLQGLFDPRSRESQVSSIIITGRNREGEARSRLDRDFLIAHEASHYWFYRFCLDEYWSKDIESFAIEFEKFYAERVRRK